MNSNKGKSRKRRTPYRKNVLLAAVIAMLLGTAAVGTSLAFLVDSTDVLTNKFLPSAVTGTIEEEFNDGELVKKNVAIKNTGDIPAYVRVTVVPNWVDDKGNVAAEVKAGDYTIDLNDSGNDDWFEGSDGFYYYSSPVEPGQTTAVLIKECSPSVSKTDASGNPLHFELHVIASLIQAEPDEAVKEAWGVTVTEDLDGTKTISK